MLNKVAIFSLAVLSVSCATLPDGKRQLSPRMIADMKNQTETPESLKWGRPVYVEVQAYSRLAKTGDIVVNGTILMNIGRESFSLDDVINSRKTY